MLSTLWVWRVGASGLGFPGLRLPFPVRATDHRVAFGWVGGMHLGRIVKWDL